MSSRDPWLDNAKMALVTLVVVGHAWMLLPASTVNDWLYDALYAWHMPAFVFVTGYLSRGFEWTGPRLWQLVRTVAVPYVLFESALVLFRVYVGGEDLTAQLVDPHWAMWFLPALFAWRLLTPVFRPMRAGVLVAVAISLVAGAWAGNTFDVARILGFLPFFVMGLHATPERLELLRAPAVRRLAVPVLVGIGVLAVWTDRLASTEALYYRSRYSDLPGGDVQEMTIRLGLLVVGALGTAAFLALLPRVGGWFTRMGAATLVVYLCHTFVVKAAQYAGAPEWTAAYPALALPLITVGGVVLSLALASEPVASRLQRLIDPFGHAQHHVTQAVELNELNEASREREIVAASR